MSLPNIGCKLEQLTFDFTTDSCVIKVPPGACPDMRSAIKYVTQRFPTVTDILTVSGDTIDTAYALEGGAWQSVNPELT